MWNQEDRRPIEDVTFQIGLNGKQKFERQERGEEHFRRKPRREMGSVCLENIQQGVAEDKEKKRDVK